MQLMRLVRLVCLARLMRLMRSRLPYRRGVPRGWRSHVRLLHRQMAFVVSHDEPQLRAPVEQLAAPVAMGVEAAMASAVVADVPEVRIAACEDDVAVEGDGNIRVVRLRHVDGLRGDNNRLRRGRCSDDCRGPRRMSGDT